MSEKKAYKVIKPVAWGGRREIGEIVRLTDGEAANLGGEYVAPEPESVTTDEVEGKAAVKPKRSRKAKKE